MPITYLRLPVFDDEGNLLREGVVEGEKQYKPSEAALPRPCIMALVDVPPFAKFSLDHKLYEKQRGGRVRKMQPGRVTTVELPEDTLVIVVL